MDGDTVAKTLAAAGGELSAAVERLTSYGLDRGAEGMQALEFAQAFAEVAATLECCSRNLAEVWAGLDAHAPELRSVAAGG